MDQKMKNFDRGIEQMMNEHEVAPPFGMWNRISSELEAMPLPVAAAAPVVTQLIPKRAIVGIIAGALFLGTSIVTGYMVNSTLNKNKAEVVTKPAVIAPVINTVAANVDAVKPVVETKHEVAPVIAKVRANHITDNTAAVAIAAQPVNATIAQPVAANNNSVIINSNTDVPTPIEPVAQSNDNQTYYFPPIDVNTPEKSQAHAPIPVAKTPIKTATPTTTAADDDKPSSGERKFRFRNHKKGGWSWGKINTTK